MDSKSRINASARPVVKVKEEEWSSSFPVPSYLVESYGGVMPSEVTLKTDESEKRWDLSIEKLAGQYFFTDGWEKFKEDVDLESRKFLMYNYKPDASSKQKGENKKRRREISGNTHGTTNSSLNENKNTGSGTEKKLSFSKEMKKYHMYRLDIPGIFVRRTGIRKGDVIKLKDIDGKEWLANVTKRAAVFSLCKGWCNFVTDNKVMLGSKISFVWLSESTILTQILEVGTSKQLLFNSMSRRGKQLQLLESDKTSDEAELSENSLLDVKNEIDDEISKANCIGVGKKWIFSTVLKKNHSYAMDLPVSFSMVVGKATSGEIELMDCQRRMWPVKYNRATSYRLTSGWIDFLVGNKASVGNMVVFKSIPNCDQVIKARVIDGKNKQKVLFVKRARGRPRSRSSKLSTSP